MPEAFEKCRKKKKSKVRTITGPRKKDPQLSEDEYVHVCIDDEGQHLGYKKKKEAKQEFEKEAKKREK